MSGNLRVFSSPRYLSRTRLTTLVSVIVSGGELIERTINAVNVNWTILKHLIQCDTVVIEFLMLVAKMP